jgi:hypothetical protein
MPSTPTCRHVLANGALCQAASLRNRDYCRFHLQQIGRRMKAARSRARQQAPMLRLPLLEDLYSVQVALMQLADAIAYREIDPQYARLLTTVLRLAMQNLKSKAWDRPSRFQLAETDAAPTTWDTFEQEHDLPPDLDLSVDPEVAFPPTGPAASGNENALRAKLGQHLREVYDAPPALVTADQVELMEVYEQQGEQAAAKLGAHQERNLRRRERRARQLFYEEVARKHNVQLAAQRLIADPARAASLAQTPRVSISEEVAQVEAAFTRKAPQHQESAGQNTPAREA